MLKRLVFHLILVLIPLAFLELLGLVSPWLIDDLYDHRDRFFARLDEGSLTASIARNGDPILGWARVPSEQTTSENCEGTRWTATYDADGARVYPGYDARRVAIVAVGDSYTNGAEVDDADAYPARLARALGIGVANHGVGGYGPVQSFLNLQTKIDRYPGARIVILGIMYENLDRMMNSYRPVLEDNTAIPYGLKPYMAGGVIVPHPGAPALRDATTFLGYAAAAFDVDFWAKPRHRFPYSVALLRALASNDFWFHRLQKSLRKIGVPEYLLTYRSPAITGELRVLLDFYAGWTTQRGLTPVVVFIPRNHYDTTSASAFIDANRALLHRDLVLIDVGTARIDWSRFNLHEPDSDDICHPSPNGQREIADFLMEFLQREGLVGNAAAVQTG